jgi:hypothetical protein
MHTSFGLILLFWMIIWEIPILFLSSVIDMPEAGVVIASAFLGTSVGKLLSGPVLQIAETINTLRPVYKQEGF